MAVQLNFFSNFPYFIRNSPSSKAAKNAKNRRKRAQDWTFYDQSSNAARGKSTVPGGILLAVLIVRQEQRHCVGLEYIAYIPDENIARHSIAHKRVDLE